MVPRIPQPLRHRVLVVDHDERQIASYRRLLGADFDVAWARDASEALLLVEHGVSFDVLVSDLRMGAGRSREPTIQGADGIALHHGLFRIAPQLLSRLLFVCEAPIEAGPYRTFARRIENPVLRKPVSPEVLLRAVRMVIAGVPVFELVEHAPASSRPAPAL
jgi:CheY-like chemotaxis protein